MDGDSFSEERNARASQFRSKDYCTEIVTGGLVPPHNVAVTVVVMPDAVELTVAAPPLMDGITAVLEIVQVTALVTSCWLRLPEKTAFATKVMAVPATGLVVDGITVMLVTTGHTVTVAVLVKAPSVAVMVVMPGGEAMLAAAFTTPLLVPTEATVVSDDCQELCEVTFDVLPSSKVPVAVIWSVPAGAMLPVVGATVMDCSVGFTKKPRQLAASASVKSAVNAAKSRSFCLIPGMRKIPAIRAFFSVFVG
jgi:hypothetical protein